MLGVRQIARAVIVRQWLSVRCPAEQIALSFVPASLFQVLDHL
jgi:hypothetical protein